jgi:hypothetical protein
MRCALDQASGDYLPGNLTGYSGSPIAVHRNHAAEWLFPQEKATFDRISKDIFIREPL